MLIGVLVLGGLAYWGYDQYREKEQLKIYIGNKYQQSFFELVDRIERVNVLLGKGLVSSSSERNIMLLTDVWSHASIAQQELTKLPLAAQTVYDTAKFLAQTGDFAHVQAKKNVERKEMSIEDREILRNLRNKAINIVETLHGIEQDVLAGRINWVELVRETGQKLGGDDNADYFGGRFDDIQEEMSNLPQLIYDGPFSDHIPERKPRALIGEEITKEEARERAREIIDTANRDVLSVSEGSKVNGSIPAYNYQVEIEGEDYNYSVDLTRKGGHLINMLTDRTVNETRVNLSEAVDKARNYLAVKGYPNMKETYSELKDNIAYISFAYQKDDILFYPDIINVQVAMDNIEILAVDAINFLMSHHEREPKEPEIGSDEAEERVSLSFDEIENVQLAVIPKSDLSEVLTYEIRGIVGEETYLVYINSDNGVEENILKVVMEESGTFAM
ncbi:MAG TPA: germination protein YpeB [Halanaerobiales bacterium]|nr:germination protein YpeB [Halanaerobiales bacterium]